MHAIYIYKAKCLIILSRFYNSVNVVVSGSHEKLTNHESNVKRLIDCDWSISYIHLRLRLRYCKMALRFTL